MVSYTFILTLILFATKINWYY